MAEIKKRPPKNPLLPREPIDSVTRPLTEFLQIQASSGIVLLLTTAAAIYLANSRWAEGFAEFWHTSVGVSWGTRQLELSLLHWINDGLMVIFFFVVGLEVKRELVHGELREFRKAALPIAGALGGMVVPAAVYLTLQLGEPGQAGWGVPMATDIAFVVGCLALFGSRIPRGLRVMMLTLAIVDDIGAILVIAIGYTHDLNMVALLLACGMIVVVLLAGRLGIRSIPIYVALGVAMWYFFHESGVHATIGGVILGIMTPAKPYLDEGPLAALVQRIGEVLRGESEPLADRFTEVQYLREAARETVPPAEFLENVLHPWVAFGVMPLFALANAGVAVSLEELRSPVAVAVVAGLVLGKPLGIVTVCWLSVRAGLAHLPLGVSWANIVGGGCLAGIGFTMSLFLANLALDESLLAPAKIGVLAATAASAVLGMALLALSCRAADGNIR